MDAAPGLDLANVQMIMVLFDWCVVDGRRNRLDMGRRHAVHIAQHGAQSPEEIFSSGIRIGGEAKFIV
jgi:hypothetical protein